MTNLAYPMLYITRKEQGDTQKKVAGKLGISPQRYQTWVAWPPLRA